MAGYGLIVVKNNDQIEAEKKEAEAVNNWSPELYESQLAQHIQKAWE